MEDFMSTLHKSLHAGPLHSRNVKINEFKPIVIHYCNNFQIGKYRFGKRCKYKREINPEFKYKVIIVDDEKKKILLQIKIKIEFYLKGKI